MKTLRSEVGTTLAVINGGKLLISYPAIAFPLLSMLNTNVGAFKFSVIYWYCCC